MRKIIRTTYIFYFIKTDSWKFEKIASVLEDVIKGDEYLKGIEKILEPYEST